MLVRQRLDNKSLTINGEIIINMVILEVSISMPSSSENFKLYGRYCHHHFVGIVNNRGWGYGNLKYGNKTEN
jgi:hypothetical protein